MDESNQKTNLTAPPKKIVITPPKRNILKDQNQAQTTIQERPAEKGRNKKEYERHEKEYREIMK